MNRNKNLRLATIFGNLRKQLALFIVLFTFLAAQSTAQLAAWNVAGINAAATNPFSATTLGANIGTASMTLGSGITASSAADTFGASAFNTTSLTAAISGGDFISFTVTPSPGFAFNTSSLVLTFGLASAVSFNVALMTSATGYSSGNEIWTYSFSTASPTAQTITLSSIPGLQNLSSATEFRIYGYRDASGTTTFRMRDLTANSGNDILLSGSTSAIPEPSTYAAIFGSLALAGAVWRRRQRKSKSV